jgi:CheY-like chemotaxis protein
MSERARIKVLVADDHLETRRMLDRLLRADGFETVLAADGDAASRRLGEGVDAVLVDLRMPGRSGLEVLREARRYYPHVPVIVISSEFSKARLLELVEHDAGAFHRKPIDWPVLRRQLWTLLRRQRALLGRPPLVERAGGE